MYRGLWIFRHDHLRSPGGDSWIDLYRVSDLGCLTYGLDFAVGQKHTHTPQNGINYISYTALPYKMGLHEFENIFDTHLFYVLCFNVCECVNLPWRAVEVRGQLAGGVGSLLPSCGFGGMKVRSSLTASSFTH